MKRMIWLGGTFIAALAFWAGVASAGSTVNDGCVAAKLIAAGDYASCRLRTEADAILKATAPSYAKCDANLLAAWTRAESVHGDCVGIGDEAAVKERIAGDTTVIGMSLGGAPTILRRMHATGVDMCTDGLGIPTACPGTGQDGEFLAGVTLAEAFTDNGDGTITDNVTGLMWEKKVMLDNVVDGANLHDADNRYPLGGRCSINAMHCQHAAECPTGEACVFTDDQGTGMTAVDWVAALNAGTGFAGYTDWRLPNRAELESIVDLGHCWPAVAPAFRGPSCGLACADMTDPACSCTALYGYWSSTPLAEFAPTTWYVWFVDGSVGAIHPEEATGNVRAVRGGL